MPRRLNKVLQVYSGLGNCLGQALQDMTLRLAPGLACLGTHLWNVDAMDKI